MEDKKMNYATKVELLETQQKLRADLHKRINEVDDKIDQINTVVLPLAEFSRLTAENTDRMAKSLDRFTEEQRKTNGKMYDRLNEHDAKLIDLGVKTKTQSEIKKANATIVVAVVTALGGLIVGIFNLAPYFFK